ncbi:hypothetical protein [Rhodohalobacter mucosus]|uniref:Bacteriophage CI repressor helix-turn-helix domain-containing protein n=1 Tax=Rhodohalobacter mucosus TaxID=2079485 RepID=A0A316TQR0_9BACT|nr:hypothetical protein [Rhodohalobacter mucosus]PWN06128.1 hypothetical protein DDZ15_09790 [Rhodohalobacter mucosus]
MPRKYSDINEIARRIIALSALYPTNRAFLDKCGITNHSLITDLKKRRIKNPGADILVKVVKGSGCSGSWLLTGHGNMFDKATTYIEEEVGVSYIMIKETSNLIDEFEKRIESDDCELTDDLQLKISKLMVKILERRMAKELQ